MKRFFLASVLAFFAFSFVSSAQVLDPVTLAKRARHRNMTIKEWNTDAKTKTRWLDRITTYDGEGRKLEEIEYTAYGQKWRETYEYGADGRIAKDVYYDDRNKPTLVRKYEYNADGTKRRQFNYSPQGVLLTVKVFEYIIAD